MKKIVPSKVQNIQSFKVRLLTIFTKLSFHVEDIEWLIGPKSGKIMSSSLKKYGNTYQDMPLQLFLKMKF